MRDARTPTDAMREKAGVNRPPLWDPNEIDTEEGTTSGERLRGRPKRGSASRKGI